MNKKHLHRVWNRIHPIKTWYLFLAFVVCLSVAVMALRSNYATMAELRENVYQADREEGDVEAALQALRRHVNSHMNTNLASGAESVYPPIQLKETYGRLVQAEQQRVENANANLYTQAQDHCEAQDPNSFSGGSRVACIQEYVDEHGQEPRPIPDALYKFDFASPSWSPDLAGWMLVISGTLLAATVIRFVLGRLFKNV
jgi:hypothetical protein